MLHNVEALKIYRSYGVYLVFRQLNYKKYSSYSWGEYDLWWIAGDTV